ncbi:MAG: pentapeptide repeat-containing protein [Cyanobacteria bacterium]|nr:pentapeptide repeat-containing protein [Cyanobacteriota bacterium]
MRLIKRLFLKRLKGKKYFIEADLSDAALSGADLIAANLSGAEFRDAIADSNTKFPNGFDAKGAGVEIHK